jgi:prepilin-type N-terminal cleavage/methylation domain-containing protein
MVTVRRGVRRPSSADLGFTLVEVIIAIVLLALVSMAMLSLFIQAMKDSTGLDRRQAAVAVASQAMEVARTIPPQRSAGDKLVSGRTQAAVNAQWTAASAADLSQTDKVWDASATVSSVPVLPLTTTTTVTGVTYTAANLVGSCRRPPAGGDCVRASSPTTDSWVEMYRIIVHVTWAETGGASCSGSACSYSLASLVDPGRDPSFNLFATNASWPPAPVLTTLTATTAMNAAVTVDLADAVTSGATPLVATTGTVTPSGTASVLPNTTNVTVTPVTGFWSGTDITVPFTLTDPYGQATSSTLTVHVNPPAGPTAAAGTRSTHLSAIQIDLAGFVTGGTGTLTYTITGRTAPFQGTLVAVSGSLVSYTPRSSWTGTDRFTYQVADTYGHTASAIVTVTVT